MRSPVEVNEMLTQTPHFPLTIMLTFVIAALVALRRESDPTLRTDACPVLSCLPLEREMPTPFGLQCPFKPKAGTTLALQGGPQRNSSQWWGYHRDAQSKRPCVVWLHSRGMSTKDTLCRQRDLGWKQRLGELGEGEGNVLKQWWWWLYNSKILLEFIELYTSYGLMLWY